MKISRWASATKHASVCNGISEPLTSLFQFAYDLILLDTDCCTISSAETTVQYDKLFGSQLDGCMCIMFCLFMILHRFQIPFEIVFSCTFVYLKGWHYNIFEEFGKSKQKCCSRYTPK